MSQTETKPVMSQQKNVSYIDHAMQQTGATVNWASIKAKQSFDKVIPPEQSDALYKNFQEFQKTNPRLSTFLLVNLVFSGVPILLFTVFSLSVLISSIITGVLLGIVGALIFTSSIVGFTLLFLIPTLLLTTIAATTLFFWSFVGLYIYTQVEQRNKRRISR